MSLDSRSLGTLLPAVLRIHDAELATGIPDLLTSAEQTELATLEASLATLDATQRQRLEELRHKRARGPLGSLLAVIAEQVAVLEEDLEQLYDDQFIETCREWVVPYIGDLIGYRSLHELPDSAVSPRAEVAHTIGFRRRKGTIVMLEQLARDVTGWDATAVEFFERLAATQYMNHRRAHIVLPDLRDSASLALVRSAFDCLPRTVDVRRIASGRGLYNIPNVGIYLWRLKSYTLTGSPAVPAGGRRYRFSALGHDVPLIGYRPPSGNTITDLASPMEVPAPISRRQFARSVGDYYGAERSIAIVVNGVPVASSEVLSCDLEDLGAGWANGPHPTKCIVDPELGRLVLPASEAAGSDVLVTYRYVFSSDLGGGQYTRLQTFEAPRAGTVTVRVPDDEATIHDALDRLGGSGTVEITNSGRYVEHPAIRAANHSMVELRAADECRPTLVLDAPMELRGQADSQIVLNGVLVTGNRLLVPQDGGNALARLSIRHCTLVPGWSLRSDGQPEHAAEPGLLIRVPLLDVSLERCVVGGIRAVPEASVRITDSLLDSTDRGRIAYSNPDEDGPGGDLDIEGCTVIGRVWTRLLKLASNSIFFAQNPTGSGWPTAVLAAQRQHGCVRFSYLPPDSQVPRRYQCQPVEGGSPIAPCFVSLRFGTGAYGQLSGRTPVAIRQGADDDSEMGAFHHVYAPQRDTNARIRADEYLRVGLEVGLIHAT